MLRSLAGMKGFKLAATDGELGDVRDFYFDDNAWTVRYLVADTSRWLAGRRVLIAPAALGEPSWEKGTIPVSLTKDQVKHAPDVDTDQPVSRQREIELARYYAWPEWWGVGGPVVPPAPAGVQSAKQRPTAVEDPSAWPADTHLRSLSEVVSYSVQARDERIGKVKDLIAQTSSWIVRYLVVDVKTWRPGGEVLLAPAWVDRIDWSDSCVVTEMSADDLRACPPYSPGEDLNREYEERLHEHLGQSKYWTS
jgi:hypothetical protein